MKRYDSISTPDWMTEKFVKTPEGFLMGKACVTSVGVFEYMNSDGSITKELRLPDEVFSESSLDSYKMKPVTNTHPTEKVTAENIKQYQVGNLGTNPMDRDNTFLTIDMIIQDANAITDIMAGKRALSVGYDMEFDPTPGTYCGQSYDGIQRNIRVNHVALCDKARQGDQARIRLDSTDAILVQDSQKEDRRMPEMKKIKIDGVEYEGEAKILESYTNAMTKADSLQTALDTLTANKTKVEAERDTLKDKVEKADAKIAELEAAKVDSKAVEAAVARRVKVLEAAKFADVEVKDGMTEAEIQKAVILKVFPKAILDSKDQVYIDARFDGAVESFEKDADAQTRQLGTETIVDGKVNTDTVVSAESARQKYLDRLSKKK